MRIIILLFLLFLTACSLPVSIREVENNVYKVSYECAISRDEIIDKAFEGLKERRDKINGKACQDAEKESMIKSQDFCSQKNKSFKLINNTSENSYIASGCYQAYCNDLPAIKHITFFKCE